MIHPDAHVQCQTVEDILGTLKLADKPRITVLNKIDRLLEPGEWDETSAISYMADYAGAEERNTVVISATRRWGLNKLLSAIRNNLSA